jgi:hypothetical protein
MDVRGWSSARGRAARIALDQRLAKPMQIARIIVLGEEARLAIVDTLHDMQWNTVEVDAGAAQLVLIFLDKSSLAPFDYRGPPFGILYPLRWFRAPRRQPRISFGL